MDEKDRKHILVNSNKLIRLTNYDELMAKCIESGLLSKKMGEKIKLAEISDDSNAEDVRHKKLFDKITHRGPEAFQHLKDCLSELKRYEALRVLNGEDFQSIKESTKPVKKIVTIDENYKPNKLENVKEKEEGEKKLLYEVIKSSSIKKDTKVGTYSMRSEHNRGVFLMVNIIDFLKSGKRNGAEEDGQALIHLFSELGFKHYAYTNLTKDNFIANLDSILKSEDVHHTECFVMALMTHGNLDSTKSECVEFHDGVTMKVSDILDHFSHYNCPNLVDKPKVFIFPFCRGDDIEYGRYRTVQTDSIAEHKTNFPPNDTIPYLSDVLICYASMRGFKSHRDSDSGNWYIQKFCELMSQHAHDTDLERIVKLVQEEVGKLRSHDGAMQTCCSENISFNKSLFFNPGVWE